VAYVSSLLLRCTVLHVNASNLMALQIGVEGELIVNAHRFTRVRTETIVVD